MDSELDCMIYLTAEVPLTESEGPGKRYAIWVAGCSIRCPGCCNPEMFERSDNGTYEVLVADLAAHIVAQEEIEGITILGGEPTEQPEAVLRLLQLLREQRPELGRILFSGRTWEELQEKHGLLLEELDCVKAGPFDYKKPEKGNPNEEPRRFLGSWNQTLHFLTPRYTREDFRGENTVEIHISKGQILFSGWPTKEMRKILKGEA